MWSNETTDMLIVLWSGENYNQFRLKIVKTSKEIKEVYNTRSVFSFFQNVKPYNCLLYSRFYHFLFGTTSEARIKLYVKWCHTIPGTYKIKGAVPIQSGGGGGRSVISIPKREIFCRVNIAERSQNCSSSSQNLGVPCPKLTLLFFLLCCKIVCAPYANWD